MEKFTSVIIAAMFAVPAMAQRTVDGTDLPTNIIKDQPEGTLEKNLYTYAHDSYYVYYNQLYWRDVDATGTDAVFGNNGEVYIKSPLTTLSLDAWIKGNTIEGDTVVFHMPQLMQMKEAKNEDGETYTKYGYLWNMKLQDTDHGTTTYVPAENQDVKFVHRNDSLFMVDGYFLGLGDENGVWYGYGDKNTVYYKVNTPIYKPADESTAVDYQMLFTDYTGATDTRKVKVAFEGDDVLIGGLSPTLPDSWIKGKKSADGKKVTFPTKQYFGFDETGTYHSFFTAMDKELVHGDYYDYTKYIFAKEIVLDLNEEDNSMSGEKVMAVNTGVNAENPLYVYDTPKFKVYKIVVGAPSAPQNLIFTPYDENTMYGMMRFDLGMTTDKEETLDPEKLYYNIYFDDKIYTFTPAEYTKLDKEYTDVPYSYNDQYDICAVSNQRTIYFYNKEAKKAGVQSFLLDNGTKYFSPLVSIDAEGNITTGINSIRNTDKDVVNIEYMDMSGRKVQSPHNGIFIAKMKLADGTVKTMKQVIK